MKTMFRIIALLITCAMVLPSLADVPQHQSFNELLNKYVSTDGTVDYAGFKSEKAKLDAYLNELATNPPSDDDGWSHNDRLAYWINLYNASTIQLILKHYPVKSIMDINSGKAWDLAFIKSGKRTLSLNQIEHEIIRKQFDEPRIHFALNCAAKSCPKLLNEAYRSTKLFTQLETSAMKFVNNNAKNHITPNSIAISKIFEWYAEDFGGKDELLRYLNKYSNVIIKANASIQYKDYDWALNGK